MRRAGRYILHAEIGRGAMGVVYLGEDPAIQRPVAIKTIDVATITEPSQYAALSSRLLREASAAGVLSHPNIVTVYDAFEENGMTYLVMEYVDGPSLYRAPIQWTQERVLDTLRRVASALDYAYSKGVVHRDVKPANILINSHGIAKITDFGVAQIVSRHTTVGGAILGTPYYMAPEQIKGQPVSGRSDQYSLAVVGYEMLSGRKPFEADTIATLVYKVLNEAPPSTGLPERVDAVLRQAMSVDPAARFASSVKFVDELRDALFPPARPVATPEVAQAPAATSSAGFKWWYAAVAGVMLIVLFAVMLRPRPSLAPEVIPPVAESKPPEVKAQPQAPEPSKPQAPPESQPAPPIERAKVIPRHEHAPGPQDLLTVSIPPNARLVFDNNPRRACMSPCEMTLLAGSHTVTAELAGFKTVTREFTIPGPRRLTILLPQDMVAPQAQGTIVVDASLKDAVIEIDGKAWPKKAPVDINLPVGDHKVKVYLRDTLMLDRVITVTANGRTLLRVSRQVKQ